MKMYMPLCVRESGVVRWHLSEGAALKPGDRLATLELDDPTAVTMAEVSAILTCLKAVIIVLISTKICLIALSFLLGGGVFVFPVFPVTIFPDFRTPPPPPALRRIFSEGRMGRRC